MSNSTIGPVDIEFALKNLNFQEEADRIKQAIRGVTNTAKGEAGKTANAFKSGFGGVEKVLDGIGLSAGALAGPAAGIAAAFKFKQLAQEALEFENAFGMAMREVQTISAAAQADFDGMSKAIVDIAANGPDDAITLAKAYYQIASAGHDGAAGLDLLTVASKASVAGVTDTMTAADGLTTVINAWGLQADQSNAVADVMFKTVERGKTTFSQLASSIAQVAPLAAANNISFNEIFAALQTITKQGTPTAQAMTQIRSSIINMNNALGDGWSETMTYQEGLNKVAEMAGGSSTELKKLIPDVEGMSAVLAMTGEKAKGAADDLNETTKAAGSMETAYGRMMQEADNKWAVVHNKWTREIREFGKALKGGSTDLADFFDRMLTDRQVDIIDPGAKSIVDGVSASISGLTDKEAKLSLIIEKIGELKKKRINEINPNITSLEKQQPGFIRQNVEALNAGIGLPQSFTPGRVKQAELSYYNQQADIMTAAEKGLQELYEKTLNAVVNPDKGGAVEKARTLKDIEAEIAEAKKSQDSASSRTEFDAVQKRIDKLEAEKTAITGAKATEKKAIDEVAAAREALRKAIESGNSTEADLQAKKIALLEAEKKKLEELIALRIYNAKHAADIEQVDDVAMKPLTSIASKGVATVGQQKIENGVVYEITAINKTGPVWKEVKKHAAELKKYEKDISEKAAKDQQKLDEETDERKKKNMQNLLDYSRQFTSELINQLGLSQDQAEQLNGFADTVANLAKGDYMAAAFSTASMLIKSFKTVTLGEMIDSLTGQVDGLISSLNTASKSADGLGVRNYSAEVELLKGQLLSLGSLTNKLNSNSKSYRDQVAEFMSSMAKDPSFMRSKENQDLYALILNIQSGYGQTVEEINKTIGSLYEKLLNPLLTEEQRSNIKKVIESYAAIKDQIDQMTQDIIGISVSDLSNSLTDAFLAGEDAAEAWGNKVDDIIKNIVSKQLTAQLLTDPINRAIATLVKDNEGGLTLDEAAAFKKTMDELYATVSPQFDLFEKTLKDAGFDFAKADGVKQSAIAGVAASATEDTVSAMVGQLMAVRVDIKEIIRQAEADQEATDKSLQLLSQIAENTSHNVKLVTIEAELKEMNRTLKDKL